jgi:hypothetical protein
LPQRWYVNNALAIRPTHRLARSTDDEPHLPADALSIPAASPPGYSPRLTTTISVQALTTLGLFNVNLFILQIHNKIILAVKCALNMFQ